MGPKEQLRFEKICKFVMTFGKYKGDTYKSIYDHDQDYIAILRRTKDKCHNTKSIESFLKYIDIIKELDSDSEDDEMPTEDESDGYDSDIDKLRKKDVVKIMIEEAEESSDEEVEDKKLTRDIVSNMTQSMTCQYCNLTIQNKYLKRHQQTSRCLNMRRDKIRSIIKKTIIRPELDMKELFNTEMVFIKNDITMCRKRLKSLMVRMSELKQYEL